MKLNRLQVYLAGAIAFLLGIPLTQKVYAQGGFEIFFESLDLAGAIADSAGDS